VTISHGVVSRVANGIGHIVLDNPPLNILTRDTLLGLREAVATLAEDRTLRVVVLAAHGKSFSAGADVGEHLPPLFHDLIPEFVATVEAVRGFALPVIAQVHGKCLGGAFELVLAADLIVASESATFGQPEIKLGVLPPVACVLLPSRLPRGLAMEMILTGDPISAGVARQYGLVTQVAPDAELEAATLTLAGRFSRYSAAVLRVGKRMLAGTATDTAQGLAVVEALYRDDLMRTEDANEGLRAFIDRRTPVWSHR
jgi:cyclohexa-1,5-dienecarbonyl-CoA hydratase